MPSQEFQVTVDGLSLRARIDSPDAVIGQSSLPWIVFSNSLLTNLHNWDQATALFQGRYNILRYDQRGHGGSDIPPASATTTIDRLTDDVAALLDHFGIKEILAFVGDSMGGATALNFAIRHATRIGAVVACDTIPQTAEAMKQTWADRIKTGAAQGMEPLADATVRRWFPEPWYSANLEEVARIRSMAQSTPHAGFVACVEALLAFDEPAGLAQALRGKPTLLVAGSKDGPVPEYMRGLASRVDGARFVEIEGAGHLPHIDGFEQWRAAVGGFLDSLPKQA